ncbi:hypothetical protein ACFP1I_11200 [Dyadobacter subterraneus]|uniref:DUF1129 family protein n=1 Tax=Dyadobacter subterraneus TaxID=2773304 RepID=A0ABR9WEY2_9BACT|nr:hypothetical protein [Dyadobacter subterraneus]MBE9463486.1 hypothetical protein [Dyadobacter subterraneus]
MKVTQAQYFEIEDFLSKKCRLSETEFIDEMTDHFIDAIEEKLKESIPFNEAMYSTIEDFGGMRAIQKMEWQFRKGFVKKQLRVLLTLWKSQLSGQKLLRSLIVTFLVTTLCFYLKLYTKDVTESYNFVNGILTGSAILPVIMLPIFLLQRYIKWLDIFGMIKSQTIVRVLITFLVALFAVLSSLIITKSGFNNLTSALLQSFIWTAFAISIISLFEYSKECEGNYWYVTK